ncbi:STAS domain-containing protein [Brevibacillus dissolubilis]|uniref:STAS domain-containing protein n=1 Tax=Brevibacillus dissolubilis TaxID=1844116 RepID=UPI001115E6F0|nr:STAS domain-containing protein [Brevibacillus dissolubilis]
MTNPNLFHIHHEETDTGTTLYLIGQLDLSMAVHFRSVVEPLAMNADKTLTLNLRDLRYIDSTGLGILVAILKVREEVGQTLIVEDVTPKVQRLLDLTGISKFLRPVPDQTAEQKGGAV